MKNGKRNERPALRPEQDAAIQAAIAAWAERLAKQAEQSR